MSRSLKSEFEEQGVINPVRGIDPEKLFPLQELIHANTVGLIESDDGSLSMQERLNLPFKRQPSQSEWSHLMHAVNESSELKEVIGDIQVREIFVQVFDAKPEPFPISPFRAQFPSQERSVYDWHQDMGTWYVVPKASSRLAEVFSVTLWLSVSGADETNSVEFALGSHKLPLHKHQNIADQGYFSAEVDGIINEFSTMKVKAEPGEGVLFHPLILHRSLVMQSSKPRYSIDIRYFDPTADFRYDVQPVFQALRKYLLEK